MLNNTKDEYQNSLDSNTNTPYDDVFRTLLVDGTRLIIPIIKETIFFNTISHIKYCEL